MNLNHPASGTNWLQNFDTHDRWALDLASFSVQANGAHFGFRLDTGFGEMYKTMNLADSWAGPNRYISQAYVSYKRIQSSALEIDAGKFFTQRRRGGSRELQQFQLFPLFPVCPVSPVNTSGCDPPSRSQNGFQSARSSWMAVTM